MPASTAADSGGMSSSDTAAINRRTRLGDSGTRGIGTVCVVAVSAVLIVAVMTVSP
jgi:hypothetical protein